MQNLNSICQLFPNYRPYNEKKKEKTTNLSCIAKVSRTGIFVIGQVCRERDLRRLSALALLEPIPYPLHWVDLSPERVDHLFKFGCNENSSIQ